MSRGPPRPGIEKHVIASIQQTTSSRLNSGVRRSDGGNCDRPSGCVSHATGTWRGIATLILRTPSDGWEV